jgi:hypothetical protein
MNIYEKMSAITIDINKVAKNLKVGVGQSQYKAVGEADILEAVKPVEAQHGIYSYPASRKVIKEAEYTTTSEYNGKVTERTSLFLRIETVYRFVNVENPEEYIDIIGYGDGVDTQDKAPGKAMTYSDKYCLMKAYKIETGDDPDQKGSEPMKPTKPVAESKIEQKTMEAITELIALSESDLDKLLKHYKVKSLSDMTHSQGEDCKRKLNVKLDQMEAESQKEGYQQLDDVNLQ